MCLCLGLSESGLFRVSGKVKLCQELRKGFDQGSFPGFDSGDIPTLASLLKLFLRELPGGLIPESHRTQLLEVFRGRWSCGGVEWTFWVLAAHKIDSSNLIESSSLYLADSKEEELNHAVRMILNSLPEEHFNVLCYLLYFLSRVAAESHLNLMTSKNLSIVFGPTIFQ